MSSKKSILKGTLEVGGATLVSRALGIIRELLQVRFLGAGALADAFLTAWKIPGSLRKIFAEGALSAAYVPTLVKMNRTGDKKHINGLMTLSFLVIEGFVFGLVIFMIWKADWVFRLIAPGWYIGSQNSETVLGLPIPAAWVGAGQPLVHVTQAIAYLRVLMSFILFVSSSALLASALQSVHHFFVPAFAPVILNIVYIAGLVVGLVFGMSPFYFCFFLVFGGLVQFLAHLYVYYKLEFGFGSIDRTSWRYFNEILTKFLPCFVSMSVAELSLFIDTSFASYLPAGSVALIFYANRFMGIPLGVFAVALSTVLLPFFSHIATESQERLNFYVSETTKLVLWATVPMTLVMGFLSEKVFHTLFLSKNFTINQAVEASHILVAFLVGLFFFAINKILLNVYYALHNTKVPAIISVIALGLNVVLNALLISRFHATGLAVATTISGIVQTGLFLLFLRLRFNVQLSGSQFFTFVARYLSQLGVILVPLWLIYTTGTMLIAHSLPAGMSDFFLYRFGFWLWVGPLCGFALLLIFYTRKWFKIELYFLDQGE